MKWWFSLRKLRAPQEPDKAVVAVFDSVSAAEGARMALIESGVPAHRIALSADFTQDGIAAEAPGQSYENQSYRGSDGPGGLDFLRSLFVFGRKPRSTDTDRARYYEAVRTGACIMTVGSGSGGDAGRIKDLMHRNGARITTERPDP